MPHARIQVSSLWPRYSALTGWRLWLSKLGWPVHRAYYVYCGGRDSSGATQFGCNADTLPALKRWLDRQGSTYTVTNKLVAVPEVKS